MQIGVRVDCNLGPCGFKGLAHCDLEGAASDM